MAKKSKWAVGSNQYQKIPQLSPQPSNSLPEVPLHAEGGRPDNYREQLNLTGVTWESSGLDLTGIRPSSLERARERFRHTLPELVWNAAKLEGNTFTLPEVQTLLDGTTVDGKRLEDQEQILALSEGYSRLDEMLSENRFAINKSVSDEIHKLVAVHEAIESGHFRGEGFVAGGGNVRLSTGDVVGGFEHGESGQALIDRFDDMTSYILTIEDKRLQSLVYFAAAARNQFYFDGNKRTARLMASGHLMQSGYDAISVPYARKLEFNRTLDELFRNNNATPVIQFLATCGI